MKNRLHLAAIVLAGAATFGILGCSSSPVATDWYFGDSLVVRVKEMRLVEEVRYAIDTQHYLIQPKQDDHVLAAAHLEVRNSEANVIYFTVKKDAIRLRDSGFLDYQAIDPFTERTDVIEVGAEENSMLPFIWGDVEMPSKCGEPDLSCQLVGWVLFEVPRDTKFYQLIWEAADTIFLRF